MIKIAGERSGRASMRWAGCCPRHPCSDNRGRGFQARCRAVGKCHDRNGVLAPVCLGARRHKKNMVGMKCPPTGGVRQIRSRKLTERLPVLAAITALAFFSASSTSSLFRPSSSASAIIRLSTVVNSCNRYRQQELNQKRLISERYV